MAAEGESGRRAGRERPGRIWVAQGERRRPFMRGIMIHSLMARGVSFEDAYLTANAVRDRLRGRETVPVRELTKAVRELLGDAAFNEESPDPLPPDIQVQGPNAVHPFSKGVLSRSLLAAALDPHEAFDVARGIERELLSRGLREIRRDELRLLTYESLRDRVGRQAAERYRVWRRFEEQHRPIAILLGGATGVGKTSLALEVAHRLGIGRVLSTDSIRQIMRIMLSPELVPALHASSFDAYQRVPETGDEEDPVLSAFRAQASTVSVGVRAILDRAVAENASVVLDGVSIAPGMIDLDAYRDRMHVVFLMLATLDEEALRKRFSGRAGEAGQRTAQRYLAHFDAILRIQDHLLELADRYDVPIVDNVSFDRSVLFVIRHVAETLRACGDLGDADPV